MVDAVTNSAISSLLRAQSAGPSAAVQSLKSNAQATQAIITQLQKGVDQQKSSTAAFASQALNSGSGSLPRGSLVDITA